MRHGSFFTGIGGFDLAAQWAGFENIFQVEIDPFCQKVLTKNFPYTKKHLDIKEFNGNNYRGQIDIISGGFPCQPFSQAGKRKGNKDERALFPELLRCIDEIQPAWCVLENVYGLVNIHDGDYFEEILSQLESLGYETQSFIIPASAFNAPHRRYRMWIIAHTRCEYGEGEKNKSKITEAVKKRTASEFERPIRRDELRIIADTAKQRFQGRGYELRNEKIFRENGIKYDSCDAPNSNEPGLGRRNARNEIGDKRFKEPLTRGLWEKGWYEVATKFCRVDARISNRVDRLKSLGNSIVPQIAYQIFEIIKTFKGE